MSSSGSSLVLSTHWTQFPHTPPHVHHPCHPLLSPTPLNICIRQTKSMISRAFVSVSSLGSYLPVHHSLNMSVTPTYIHLPYDIMHPCFCLFLVMDFLQVILLSVCLNPIFACSYGFSHGGLKLNHSKAFFLDTYLLAGFALYLLLIDIFAFAFS